MNTELAKITRSLEAPRGNEHESSFSLMPFCGGERWYRDDDDDDDDDAEIDTFWDCGARSLGDMVDQRICVETSVRASDMELRN